MGGYYARRTFNGGTFLGVVSYGKGRIFWHYLGLNKKKTIQVFSTETKDQH